MHPSTITLHPFEKLAFSHNFWRQEIVVLRVPAKADQGEVDWCCQHFNLTVHCFDMKHKYPRGNYVWNSFCCVWNFFNCVGNFLLSRFECHSIVIKPLHFQDFVCGHMNCFQDMLFFFRQGDGNVFERQDAANVINWSFPSWIVISSTL